MKRFVSLLLALLLILAFFAVGTSAAKTLTGKIIILDAGHGSGMNTYKGYDEGDAMFELQFKVQDALEKQGAEVIILRETRDNIELATRTAMINYITLEYLRDVKTSKLGSGTAYDDMLLNMDISEIDRLIEIMYQVADDPTTYAPIYMNSPFDSTGERVIHPDLEKIFDFQTEPEVRDTFLMYSLHTNATGLPINESANGVVTFYQSNTSMNGNYYTNYANVDRCIFLANYMSGEIANIGFNNNGIQLRNLHVTREHNISSVMVEHGFHTNDYDREMLLNDIVRDKIAQAYVNSTIAFFTYIQNEVVEVFNPTLSDFNDLNSTDWHSSYIETALEMKVFNGITNTTFAPDNQMTRAMFFVTLMRFDDIYGLYPEEYSNDLFLNDAKDTNWFFEALSWANSNNLFNDTDLIIGDYIFPDQEITRQEAAKVLYTYLNSELNNFEFTNISFLDNDEILAENVHAISILSSLGIIVGDNLGNFNPNNSLTRAEYCVLVTRLCDYLTKNII